MGVGMKTLKRCAALSALFVGLLTLGGWAAAQQTFIVMASTTSTEQSGLFPYLLPAFKAATGIEVQVVAVGTGQALDMGRRGDADVLFVHDTAAEEKFVAEGYGAEAQRRDVQRLRAGRPEERPGRREGPRHRRGAEEARRRSTRRSSRAATRAAPTPPSCATGRRPASPRRPARVKGYKECGCGMGPALNIASSEGAYVLSDRGTWLNFKNRGDLEVLVEGDKKLFNQYGVMVVNPAKNPHVKTALAQKFVDWVLSPAGQQTIADYKIDGQQLFFPNAKR